MSDEGGRSAEKLQQDYANYRVFDEHYEEIGKVDDLFVDEHDRPEYIGVKMGFLGMKSTLIPMDIVRANDRREILEVAASKEAIKNAPSFDDNETVSPEHEAEIRQYYGLTSSGRGDRHDNYGSDYSSTGSSEVDVEYGERGETGAPLETPPRTEERRTPPPPPEQESVRPETTGEDELTVERREEELRAGTREREAGAVNVRRRVRTDREQVRVPKKREEITVERVPVEDSASGRSTERTTETESGEEEIRIPVVEEEVVVEKRPVVKEEIRIKKDVVEEEEVVEEDVRKEEIEVEGEADYRNR